MSWCTATWTNLCEVQLTHRRSFPRCLCVAGRWVIAGTMGGGRDHAESLVALDAATLARVGDPSPQPHGSWVWSVWAGPGGRLWAGVGRQLVTWPDWEQGGDAE
uniref:Uncharacterized protein n=1 Tax=Cryptomonas paramaecium TaxID=2898 RepID=A0A7S4ULV3_9CRYP|mmetsp:Transcript_10187/g.29235  ORF Transcript_10187/g.29235 Transcript_10187/m.29235 type:complete len:104 (+) Transcript_10187:148-459(+)